MDLNDFQNSRRNLKLIHPSETELGLVLVGTYFTHQEHSEQSKQSDSHHAPLKCSGMCQVVLTVYGPGELETEVGSGLHGQHTEADAYFEHCGQLHAWCRSLH